MLKNHTTRSGILVAGNWILDQVKLIDKFPEEQSLVNILHEYSGNGGSAYNILMNLVKLKAGFPLEAIGLVGKDASGARIINHCREMGIDTRQLHSLPDTATSYTIVTSVKGTGKRTFFHHRGANALLDSRHFDFTISNAKIFHLGYLLLLDRLDEIQPDGRTKASYILEHAKAAGFTTSIDLVSEDSNRFSSIVPSALPYVDYLFLNEYEASRLANIHLSDALNIMEMANRIDQVFEKIFAMGVNEWIIIHHSDGAWAAHKNDTKLFQPSIQLPDNKVVGTNGAGDALAAGVLMGIHNNWSMQASLNLGVCAAASSLSSATCSDSILSYTDCLKLPDSYGYKLVQETK